jgi:hypothetical protein
LVTCYSPVRHSVHRASSMSSFDLHVLGTPPAFVLSQDQTLRCEKPEQLLSNAICELIDRAFGISTFETHSTRKVDRRDVVPAVVGPLNNISEPRLSISFVGCSLRPSVVAEAAEWMASFEQNAAAADQHPLAARPKR